MADSAACVLAEPTGSHLTSTATATMSHYLKAVMATCIFGRGGDFRSEVHWYYVQQDGTTDEGEVSSRHATEDASVLCQGR